MTQIVSLRAARRRRADKVSPLVAWGLLLPFLTLLVAFGILPIASALWASLGGFGGRDPFGLETYQRAFGNLNFLPAAVNVATFLLVMLPPLLAITTVVALVLHSRPGRFASVLKMVYYLPGAIVGAPLVLLWLFMLTPQLSPFRPLLTLFGFHDASDVFTSQNLPVIFAIIAIYAGVGGWIVVLHGALDAIDPALLEAARLDGANAVQQAWQIKVPLVGRYIAFIAIISFAGSAQLVAEPNLVFGALPGTVSKTWSLNQLAFYYAFTQQDGAAASAYAMLLVAIGVAGALVLIFGLKTYGSETDR